MSERYSEIANDRLSPTDFEPIPQISFFWQITLIIGIITVLLGALKLNSPTAKPKLAHAKWGGTTQRIKARKEACKQIREGGSKENLALFIGTPAGISRKLESGREVINIPPDPNSIYLTNCQENILVIGGTGSGKSYSGVTPLLMSLMIQGATIYNYDFKSHEVPSPSDKVLGYAASWDYKIYHVGAGYPESCSLNLLDFIRDEYDFETAYELATVLVKNLELTTENSSGSSSFFTNAGIQLLQAVLMLAKTTEKPDIATCHKILSLPNLISRLKVAELPQTIKVAFDNFLSSAGAEETAAGIATTASLLMTRFMNPKILATFAGDTTMPLDHDDRVMVVFKLNPRQRALAGPLIASALEMLVNRNIYRQRHNFLAVVADENNSIYLPSQQDWLNQNRSSKFCFISAIQSKGFFEYRYGQKMTEGIFGGFGTQIIFKLNDNYTSEYYTKQLGTEEIKYKTKSKSTGKHGNTNTSEQRQTKPLFDIYQLQQLKRGEAIIISPGHTDGKRQKIPIKLQVKIPARDRRALNKSKAEFSKIRKRLILRNQKLGLFYQNKMKRENVDRMLAVAERVAHQNLPTLEELIAEETANNFNDYLEED